MNFFKWGQNKNKKSAEFANKMSLALNGNSYQFTDFEKNFFTSLLAVKSALGLTPHEKQIEAAYLMFNGISVDMPTGEGKTIALAIAASVHILSGEYKVIVCSSNNELSSRDIHYLSPYFGELDITATGLTSIDSLSSQIVYCSYSTLASAVLELDKNTSMSKQFLGDMDSIVLLDEIDTIVIDQGVSPVSISSKRNVDSDAFAELSLINDILDNSDFEIDLDTKNVYFTDNAVSKIMDKIGIDIYSLDQTNLLHSLSIFVKAFRVMSKNVDYFVENDQILVVDPYTGLSKPGHEFTGGLQQALQFKENVPLTPETYLIDTITTKRCFSKFKSVCGCSGTARLAEEEIRISTRSTVVSVDRFYPSNVSDLGLRIFKDKKSMFEEAFITLFELRSNNNSPLLLIFDTSKEGYSFVDNFLKDSGLSYSLALGDDIKNDQFVLSRAGEVGALTVATVAAGRGVDIVLSNEVENGMNLMTIGAFYSLRSTFQANGRVGRHGDVGSFQGFCSLEDSLIVEFGGSSLQKIKKFVDNESETELTGQMFKKLFTAAQKESDANIKDILNNIYQYDEIIGIQREAFLSTRNSVLSDLDFKLDWMKRMVGRYKQAFVSANNVHDIDLLSDGKIGSLLNLSIGVNIFDESLESMNGFESIVLLKINTLSDFSDLSVPVTQTAIFVLDSLWSNHFRVLFDLKEGIHLRSLNNKDPFSEFKRDSYKLYSLFSDKVAHNLVENVLGAGYSLLRKMATKM